MDRVPVRCPHCDSRRIERLALYGSQLMTSQCRCEACGELFEVVRRTGARTPSDDLRDETGDAPTLDAKAEPE
jgi:transposase-like protein